MSCQLFWYVTVSEYVKEEKSNKLISTEMCNWKGNFSPCGVHANGSLLSGGKISDDWTVVGPAGGTLLFLIAPTPWYTACRGCAGAELSEKGESTVYCRRWLIDCIFLEKCVLFCWDRFSITTYRNDYIKKCESSSLPRWSYTVIV